MLIVQIEVVNWRGNLIRLQRNGLFFKQDHLFFLTDSVFVRTIRRMKLRAKMLLSIGGLFIVSLLAFDLLNTRTLDPEFERQGLEMVSLLSQRGRDSLEKTIQSAESDLQILTRLFVPSTGVLKEPGPSFLKSSGFGPLSFFEKTGETWKWLGPRTQVGEKLLVNQAEESQSENQSDNKSDNKTAPTEKKPTESELSNEEPPALPAVTEGKVLAASNKGWTLILRQASYLLVLQLPEKSFNFFKDVGDKAHSFLVIKKNSKFEFHDKASLISDRAQFEGIGEEKLLQDWIAASDFSEKVESVKWNEKTWLAALAPSAQFGFAILTLWPRNTVEAQWLNLKDRLHSLIGIMVGLCIILTLFIIRSMTSPLEEMESATVQIGQGKFNLNFPHKRQDEFGRLMTAFEIMGRRIQELLRSVQQKTRMEMELKTAKIVQENFYPPEKNDFGNLKIVGRTLASGECGGDLWACWSNEKFCFILVADATGHGVPAALLTSSLRAVVSVFQLTEMDNFEAMILMLRHAIQDTGKGKNCMTMFFVQENLATGHCRVFNAAHETAYLIPAQVTTSTKWKELETITTPLNAVLGDPIKSPDQLTEFYLQPGQKLFIYTDGVIDLHDNNKKQWKEREFMKDLLRCSRESSDLEEVLISFSAVIEKRRQGRALVDDLTIVLLERPLLSPGN